VVRLDAGEPKLLVVALEERLAAKTRKRRERQRTVTARDLEVFLARLRVVATRPHLLIRNRGHVHAARIELRQVATRRRVERNGDEPLVHVDDAVLVDPVVTGLAVLHLLLVVDGARPLPELAPGAAFDPGTLLAEPRRQVALPDVPRLDHMVVDAHDLRHLVHAGVPPD